LFLLWLVACAVALLLSWLPEALGATRSYAAKSAFAKRQACPATAKNTVSCKGFVIDHVKALDCGGADSPDNMQWLTIEAGKAKDKTERNGPECQHRTTGKQSE
jgi:hypothetical protein